MRLYQAVKVSLLDFSIFQLVLIMFAFKDYSRISYFSQIFAFGVCILFLISRNGIIVKKATMEYAIFKLVFLIFCLLSTMWAAYSTAVVNQCSTITFRMMTGITVVSYIQNKERLKRIVNFMTIGAIALCVRLLIVVPASAWGNVRVGKFLAHDSANSYGNTGITYVLGMVCVYLFAGINENVKKWQRVMLILVLSCFSLMSGSKKQIVILLICGVILLFWRSKSVGQFIQYFVLFSIIISISIFLIFNVEALYSIIGQRVLGFLNLFGVESEVSMDLSTIGRKKILEEAFINFKNRPVLGVGLDCFRYVNEFSNVWAENNYLEMLVDIGLVGFCVFYSYHFYLFGQLICHFNKNDEYVLLALLTFINLLMIDGTMVTYANSSLQFHFSILVGIIWCIRKDSISG